MRCMCPACLDHGAIGGCPECGRQKNAPASLGLMEALFGVFAPGVGISIERKPDPKFVSSRVVAGPALPVVEVAEDETRENAGPCL